MSATAPSRGFRPARDPVHFASEWKRVVGGERTEAWEVKFLDRLKTNYSEGILQGYLPQSRTKVWRSKMIRDHCSPHHKRWHPWIGDFLVVRGWACSAAIANISIYVHVQHPSRGLREHPQHVFYSFTRKLWGYSLRGEYVRKSET